MRPPLVRVINKMATISLNRFEGGITADARDETPGVVKMVKHFDILTRPKSLTPFHSQVTGDSVPTTHQFTDFLYYNSNVYAAGIDGSTGKITVHYKSDFTSTTWNSFANNAGTTGNPIRGVFIEYHGKAYGFYDTGLVWVDDLAGGAWNESGTGTSTTISSSATVGSIAACVHSKDDCLYMATKNVIGRNNNGTWNAAALTLPTRYVITAMCEYGNYLAIACKPIYSGKSVVYLWDRDSSLNTVSEVIDWGFGNIQVLEQVDGELIGISLRQDPLSLGVGNNRIIFRHYVSGAGAVTFKELLGSSATGLQLLTGQKFNANRLYFLAGITIDSVLHNGVWGLGKNQYGRWVVWFDKLPNNDTAIAGSSLVGFFVIGDFTFIAYNDSGYKLTQTTNNISVYTGSSLIETVVNPLMPLVDQTKNKQVTGLAVSCEPIPSGGQIVAKYKVDGGSWTTVFTETTTGRVTSEKNFSSVLGREFEFRVESTGGVVITEIKYMYENRKTLL